MRKLFGAFVSIMILANQATTVVPNTVADSAKTPVKTEGTYTLTLNTKNVAPIEVKSTKSSFDSVREHLVAEQNAKIAAAEEAKKAEAAKAEAAKKAAAVKPVAVVAPNPVVVVQSGDVWGQLRQCEAGGNYARNSGNGYYGAYQFDIPTWRSVGGTGDPAAASPAEQDYRALLLLRARGTRPWPNCGR